MTTKTPGKNGSSKSPPKPRRQRIEDVLARLWEARSALLDVMDQTKDAQRVGRLLAVNEQFTKIRETLQLFAEYP